MTAYAEVIGDPIAQSKSPAIHRFWLEKLGIDADYRATHVRPQDLADYFARRRGDADWRGCNVTIPHKMPVLALADRSEATASKVMAANCILSSTVGLIASNTDIDGIKEAIGDGWWGGACLLGNGGAARAALAHLANPDENKNAPRQRPVNIVARDLAKSKALLDEFHLEGEAFSFGDAAEGMRDAQLVMNATSLGMIGQQPLPQKVLAALKTAHADAIVFDMVYAPIETDLLREARRLGMTAVDGLTMLIGQAARAFELFFGAKAPRQQDAELRALLTS